MSSYLKLQNGSDIRGIALEGVAGESVNLTDLQAYCVTISWVNWLSHRLSKPAHSLRIAVACDSRLSGPSLKNGIFSALNQCDVYSLDCGIASTPSVFMATQFEASHCDGGIMITASHLPFNRNGLKFFTKEGGLDNPDIRSILENVQPQDTYPTSTKASQPFDLIGTYANHLCHLIKEGVQADDYEHPLSDMHLIVDAGNGAGGFFASLVLQKLGADISGSQFLDPDGHFPNHIPNPEDHEAITSISDATIRVKADLGIIFDTDVDRAAVVDHQGNAINRNRLIALMSAITLEKNPGSIIVTDSVTSDGLGDFIESHGGHHHRFKRGYKNVINEAIRLNSQGKESFLAIETSGHGAFKENYFLDDGAYIVTKILIRFAQLRQKGQDIATLIRTLKEPQEATEIRCKILDDNFKDYGQKILNAFKSYVESNDHYTLVSPNYEGVRANYQFDQASGWILLRLSLHDPVLPINIESNVIGGLKAVKEDLDTFLASFDKLH